MVVESTHTVVIGHSKMVGCRALLLLALSLLLQVVVGYWSRFSCVENRYLVVLRARASKKKELDSSGAATGSNDSNGEYNDLNFATQLQQLISGTVVEKAQSNNGRNSQSEIAKVRLQENLKEIEAIAKKMELTGKYNALNVQTVEKKNTGNYLSEYSNIQANEKDLSQEYSSSGKTGNEEELGVLLAKDFVEQVALADENGDELNLGWTPESIGGLTDTAKLARERLLKSLDEGPPEYSGPMCPRCNNAAEEDDLAYFGVCTLCRQIELTEEHNANAKTMSSNNKFTYSPRSVKDGAASPTKWSSNSSHNKMDVQKQQSNSRSSDIAVVTTDSTHRETPVKSKQINTNASRGNVGEVAHIPEPVELDTKSQWPRINENGFKLLSDIDIEPYYDNDYSSDSIGLEDRIAVLEHSLHAHALELENLSNVVSRLDNVIALVEDLEVQILSNKAVLEEQKKIIQQQRGDISDLTKYIKDTRKAIAAKYNFDLPEYKERK